MKKVNNKLLPVYFLLGIFILFSFFVFSPRALASTLVTEDIDTNTTWNTEGSPYIIENRILIDTGSTLTINPGVVVKFTENADIIVFGDIVANGAVDNKIYFTSNYDDTLGGATSSECHEDLDADLNIIEICEPSGVSPHKGDWGGIYFFDSHNNALSNVVVEYAEMFSYAENTYLNLKNVEIRDSGRGILAEVTNIDADNFNCTDLSGQCLFAEAGSTVNWVNSALDTIVGNALYVLDSTFNIKNIVIQKIKGVGIYIFGNSLFDAEGLEMKEVSDDNYQLFSYNDGTTNIKNSSFKNCQAEGCVFISENTSGIEVPGKMNIENTVFDGGVNYGIFDVGNNVLVNISHSVFKNFEGGAIQSYAPYTVHAKHNWWGDVSGPYNENTNLDGKGGAVSLNVEFIPWCKQESCPTRNPVIIVPGITGTYLLKDDSSHDEIWPNLLKLVLPGDDSFLNYLAFDANGKENPDNPVVPGDIIRGAMGVHVFDDLIDKLTADGYIENTDLFVFPYDWRRSSTENAIFLKNKIDRILSDIGGQKVDVIAHSMGGLIVKKYIASNEDNNVEHLVFVGTPHFGAPKAFKVLMYGDDMGYGKLLLGLNPDRAKYISQNMPSVYELLPSEKYVSINGDYVINSMDKNNQIELDYDKVKNLMIEKGRNPEMYPIAENIHDSIDNMDLSGIDTYNFVGCGTKTIGQIILKKKYSWISPLLSWKDDYDLKYVNGDETVPLVSADGVLTNNKYYVKEITHGSLPSGDGVKEDISAILKDESLPSSQNILNNVASCNISGKVVSTHSPVKLNIYDEAGNHTGPNADGEIEENIPGVQYDVVEGEKFAFLPDGKNYKIITNATDIGGYNFLIKDQDKDDNITNIFDWTLIPLKTTQAQGEIWVGPDYPESNYSVNMDNEGDGKTDQTFPVSYDGTAFAEQSAIPSVISGGKSGGTIVSFPKINPVVQITEVVKDKTLPFEIEKIAKKSITIDAVSDIQKEKIQEEGVLNNKLTANVDNTGISFNKIWIIITGVLIGFLLAKKFIKV